MFTAVRIWGGWGLRQMVLSGKRPWIEGKDQWEHSALAINLRRLPVWCPSLCFCLSPTVMWTPCGHLCFYYSGMSCLRTFELSLSLLFLLMRVSFWSARIFLFFSPSIKRALFWAAFSNWEKRLERASVSSYSLYFGIDISTMILKVRNVVSSRHVKKAQPSLNPTLESCQYISSLKPLFHIC